MSTSLQLQIFVLFMVSYSKELEVQRLNNISSPQNLFHHSSGIHNNILCLINEIYTYPNILDNNYQSMYYINLSSSQLIYEVVNITLPIDRVLSIHYWGQNSVQVQSKLFIINAGIEHNISKPYAARSMFIFDLSTKTYVNLSTYSSQPILDGLAPCVVHHKNLIYAIGGTFNFSYRKMTQLYNISADYWSILADTNVARAFAGCAFANAENMFLFGGEREQIFRNESVERYSVKENKWYVMDKVLMAHNDGYRDIFWANTVCALFPFDQRIYCFEDLSWEYYVQIFDPHDYSLEIRHMPYYMHLTSIAMWTNQCMIITSYEGIEYYGHCNFNPTPTAAPTIQPTIGPITNSTHSTSYIESNINSPYHSYLGYVIIAVVCVII
eukprot:244333_1